MPREGRGAQAEDGGRGANVAPLPTIFALRPRLRARGSRLRRVARRERVLDGLRAITLPPLRSPSQPARVDRIAHPHIPLLIPLSCGHGESPSRRSSASWQMRFALTGGHLGALCMQPDPRSCHRAELSPAARPAPSRLPYGTRSGDVYVRLCACQRIDDVRSSRRRSAQVVGEPSLPGLPACSQESSCLSPSG